jgi:SP family sugar:H+ symporter-like MFS transporter
MNKYLNILRPTRRAASPASGDRVSQEKRRHPSLGSLSYSYHDSPVPRVTIHSFIMGVFVSMGGFIFGYDTGQISGFLVR